MYDTPPMEKHNKKILIIIIVIIDILAVIVLYMAEYIEIARWTEVISVVLWGLAYFCITAKDDIEKRYDSIKEKISYREDYINDSKNDWSEIRPEDIKEYDGWKKEKHEIENNYAFYYFKEIFPSCILWVPLSMWIALFFTILPILLLVTWTRQREIKHLPSLTEVRRDCYIKWNIEFEWTEKIYHLPWCSHYNETVINSNFWEKWFCTEKEAKDAWWRKCQEF